MKSLAKTGKLLIIFASTIIVILIAASLLLQDKVTSIIINSLNKNINSRIEAGNVKLSFLRNFPNGSVELKNVLVTSPVNAYPDKEQFPDTLLFAESLFLEFRPFDALRGIYNIKSIDVRSGVLNLFVAQDGVVNYKVASTREASNSSEPVNINLEKISLSHIKSSYADKKNKFSLNGEIRSGKLTSRIFGSRIDFKSEALLLVNSLNVSDLSFNNPFEASVDLKMLSNEEGVVFEKSNFTIDGMTFSLEGTLEQNDADLKIKAENVNISESLKFLPSAIREKFSGYRTGGNLWVNCTISGSAGNMLMGTDFRISKGVFSSGSTVIKEIAAQGKYTTDFRQQQVLDITGLNLKPGNSEVAGSFRINNFDNYPVEAHLTGTFLAADIRDLFGYENINKAEGSAHFDLTFNENIDISGLTARNLLLLNPEGTIVFNSFRIGLKDPVFEIKAATGTLRMSENITAENLGFIYKGQEITVNGSFRNLPRWIAGNKVTLEAKGDIAFDKFLPELFMDPEGNKDNRAVLLPGDMLLNMNFKAGTVTYKNFSAQDVIGYLNYKPRIITFTDLNMKSLEGSISGDGFIVQNSGKSFISKGDFNFKNIDVNKAFRTFNNFGQDFIIASNLSGIISGSVSLLLPTDSLFNINAKSITAEGNYNIQNGALINFEPVKQLSDFIELSELENINFQTIQNDFYIRNNILFIPQMDVRSSAADIAVNGKHTFDNTYEYHVRVLLSQILSKKRKSVRKPITEFGAVQDDGLGRTSLLLKVESRGDDVRVGYDIKAVGNEVKQGIQKEKESLKTIMKEEYGWYSDDNQAPAEKTETPKKFTITWSETDSIPEENIESEEKPRTGLFRKR